MAQDEKKSTSEFHSRPKRCPRYFLCGICNIVSIAENTGGGRKGSENKLPRGREKCFEHKFTTNQDTIESLSNLSSKDETSVESQELNQNLFPSKGTVFCHGAGMTKICWNADDDVGNLDNIQRDSIDSGAEEILLRISQNTVAQENSEEPRQGKVSTSSRQFRQDEEDWVNETKRRGQQMNSMAKDQRIFPREHSLESFVPTENPTLDKEASSLEIISKDASGCGKKSSSVPEIKINGTVVKPAYVEPETSSAVSRWKRTVALKVNANRRKRMQRDSITMNEEYELMIKNLKHYGVL